MILLLKYLMGNLFDKTQASGKGSDPPIEPTPMKTSSVQGIWYKRKKLNFKLNF